MSNPEISISQEMPKITALDYFKSVDMLLSSKDVPQNIKASLQKKFGYKHPLDPLSLKDLRPYFEKLLTLNEVGLSFKIQVIEALVFSLREVDKDEIEIERWDSILKDLHAKHKKMPKKKGVYEY